MKVNTENRDEALPGEGLDFSKMPGHWLLAQMGKRQGNTTSRRMVSSAGRSWFHGNRAGNDTDALAGARAIHTG